MNIIPPQKDSSLVLVVDDDNFMRIQLRRAMEQAGYQVAEVSDGEQALTAYTHLNPDIVLLDALMPVMDGFTCCTKLQALPGGENVPILMITALEDQESVDQAFAAGATDYITKPIHWAVLRQRVRWMLEASRATEELRQQTERSQLGEERLRLALDAAQMGTWDWDIPKNQISYSPKLEAIFGLRSELCHLTYEAFLNSIHPEDRDRFAQAVQCAIEQGTDHALEFRVILPDGTVRWIGDKAKVYYDKTSKPLRLVAATLDITERKQAEEELRRNEEFLRRIIKSSPDCIKVLDLEGRLLYMSAGGQSLLEIDNFSAFRNSQWVDFWQEIYNQPARSAVETAKAGGVGKFQGYCPTAKGTPKWWEVVVTPLLDAEGKPEKLLSVSRDITERKQAEEVLQESNQRVINIFESITDAFFALDKEWQFTYLNRQAEQLLQRTRAELLGKSIWDEFPEAATSAFYQEYHRAVATNVSVEFEELYPSLNTWFEVHAYPSQDGLSVYFQDINQRKQAEFALRESEQRLKLALQTAKLGSWQLNLQTGELSLSQQCKADFGLPPEVELSYDALFELIHPEDRAYARQSISRALEQQTDYEAEYRIIWEDGSVHWILTRGRGIYQANGSPTRIIGVTLDITERKRSEEALQQTTTLQRAILASANYTIISTDIDGTILTFNAAAEQWLGYSAAEIVGKTTPVIIHDQNEIIQRARELSQEMGVHIEPSFEVFIAKAQRGELDEHEWSYIRKDGSRFPVLLSITRLVNAEGNIAGFLGIGSDITERKLVEAELQRQNRRSQLFADITLKIRQSLQIEEILQTTVTEVQNLLQADRVLIFRLWSNGVGQILTEAVVPEYLSVVGQNITDECFGSNYLKKYIQGRIYTISDVDKAGVQPCLVEFMHQFSVKAKLVMPILLKKDLWGLLIVHQCSSPRQWTSFEIELLRQLADQIGIALAQAQILEAETRRREELNRSNEELQQFASIASHDLQEPLRKIQTFGNRLKTSCSGTLTTQGYDYLERMQNAAHRMQSLIEDLLILSRITTRAQPFALVNLAQVTREVLSDLEIRIQQTHGRVEVGELPYIEADPLQMRQLLQNLIGNALKFHKDQPPVVKVYGRLLVGQEQQPAKGAVAVELCQLLVEDNGIGFDEKYLDRIFNVFQRLHSRSEYEGTGMGLAICRKITERHSGSITATSTPGQGATFIVTLPIKQPRGDAE